MCGSAGRRGCKVAFNPRQRDVPRVPEENRRLYRAIEALARRTQHLTDTAASNEPMTGYGLYSARPAAGVEGRLYFASNSSLVYRDNGSSWDSFHPLTMQKLTPSFPQLGDFTQLNFAVNVSASAAGSDVYLHDPATAALNLRGLYKTAPARPYTITVAVMPNAFHPTNGYNLFFRESGSGKLASLMVFNNAGFVEVTSDKWTSETVYGAGYGSFHASPVAPLFLRIAEDNTNRTVSISTNGVDFQAYHQIGRTDWLTADQVGIGWFSQSANLPAGFRWLSWNQAGGL